MVFGDHGQAARGQAARGQAARGQAAREQAARGQAAREQAARGQAAWVFGAATRRNPMRGVLDATVFDDNGSRAADQAGDRPPAMEDWRDPCP